MQEISRDSLALCFTINARLLERGQIRKAAIFNIE
jgi:hypothetical protein